MIDRDVHIQATLHALHHAPVVAVLGARQVGKTTLASQVSQRWKGPTTHFDLESPRDQAQLADPMLALEGLAGLVVLDEIQLAPNVFSTLRVLCDRPDNPATFLVLGSASPALLRQGAETLAGRISFQTLRGFSLLDVPDANRLWLRGGFPRSYLATDDAVSASWRRDFVSTFLHRDLPSLGISTSSTTMRRFWTMIAHYHGQTWNGSELGRAFGVSHTSVRRYVDALSDALVVDQLQPWHANLSKRQVKSPKVYISDTGILHQLLGIETLSELKGHPKVGASFEGFALRSVIAATGAEPQDCWFWGTHGGAELDLLVIRGPHRRGYEFKHTSSPKVTRSMGVAMADLALDSLHVVTPGDAVFPLAAGITAVGVESLDVLKSVRERPVSG